MICPRCHRRYETDHRFCPHDGEKLVDTPDIRRIRSQPTQMSGTVIAGRYQIRGILGRGAMAEVFLAQDMQTGAPVAVKVLHPRFRREPRMRARFIIEAKAAATIAHPSIVEILDIGLHQDAPYIVMEFLFGESLSAFLLRDKRMEPERGVPFVRQIASGLGAAHRAGIIHRDVKSANVYLIGEKGSPYAAKMVDFGFAKLYETTGVTQVGVAVGTVEYMAPEQTVSDPADARTDVYGLGVVMYRMFSGRLPFQLIRGFVPAPADHDEVLMLAHQLVTHPVAPGLGDAPVARGLEAVIVKALRKRPEHRYASMEALIEDLDRVATPERLAARAPLPAPDVYSPQTAFSKNVARALYHQLGKQAPPM